MGYVYTPDEFAGGRIARPEDYRNAMFALMGAMKSMAELGYIYGANVHGSNLNGDGGVGSDIDTLVVTTHQQAESELDALRNRIKSEHSVPVDMVPLPMEMASSGHHNIDFFYAQYIQEFCGHGVVGRDPFGKIAPGEYWTDHAGEVRKGLQDQIIKMAKRRANLPIEFNEMHCDHLEKLMRQPIYAAIQMLRLNLGRTPSRDRRPLPKEECVAVYGREFPEMGSIMPDLMAVMDLRRRYRTLLTESRDLAQYKSMLEEADGIYGSARRVIEANFEALLKL